MTSLLTRNGGWVHSFGSGRILMIVLSPVRV